MFANRTPVSSTRYALRIGDATELQLSSGIWVATASGSTAAIHSCGGEIRPMHDHRLQWRVREPYLRDGERRVLLNGFTDEIEIVSRSDKNTLYWTGMASRSRFREAPARASSVHPTSCSRTSTHRPTC